MNPLSLRSYLATPAAVVLALLFSACGPSVRTAIRYDAKPFGATELKQTKDGLTLEFASVTEVPPELVIQAPACSTDGGIWKDASGQGKMVQLPLLSEKRGQDINRVVITNSTDHVLRLNQAVVKLTDPAGNSYELLSKDDAIGMVATAHGGCVPGVGAAQLRTLKLFDRSVEIMPQSTWRGYAVFGVPTAAGQQAGTWKYAFYELPITVDDTGRATKTTRFEIRYVVKKFVDTYQRDSAFSEEKLVASKEAE